MMKKHMQVKNFVIYMTQAHFYEGSHMHLTVL